MICDEKDVEPISRRSIRRSACARWTWSLAGWGVFRRIAWSRRMRGVRGCQNNVRASKTGKANLRNLFHISTSIYLRFGRARKITIINGSDGNRLFRCFTAPALGELTWNVCFSQHSIIGWMEFTLWILPVERGHRLTQLCKWFRKPLRNETHHVRKKTSSFDTKKLGPSLEPFISFTCW